MERTKPPCPTGLQHGLPPLDISLVLDFIFPFLPDMLIPHQAWLEITGESCLSGSPEVREGTRRREDSAPHQIHRASIAAQPAK